MSDTTLDPAATAQPASGTAVYSLRGTLIEACSCNVNCPCWIGEDPDLSRHPALARSISRRVDQTSIS